MNRERAHPYMIAHYKKDGWLPTWISYYPDEPEKNRESMISVGHGMNRSHPQGPFLQPVMMLEWAPTIFHKNPLDGKRWEPGPPGWFKNQCKEAGCAWFVPFVERMAAGEAIPIEEIKAAYRENNGGNELEQKPIYELT